MNTNNILAKTSAAFALAFAGVAPACAQTASLAGAPPLFFNSAARSTDNNTILLVSAGVLLIGLVDSNNTLIILGGAGVLYTVIGSGQNRYQYHDLAKRGPLSFGLATYGPLTPNSPKPSPFIERTWKF